MVVVVRNDVEVASWPLACSDRPDLTLVDGLARLQLAAHRVGCAIRLVEPSEALRELLHLVGLADLLLRPPRLVVEAGGQPERGEELGVKEVVMPDDPLA